MRIMATQSKPAKRGTNVSLDAALVEEAKQLGVNLSQSCQQGLSTAVRAERERRWLAENADAIASSNAWVEKHGLPLARYRLF